MCVLDFCWHLLLVTKLEWEALDTLTRPARDVRSLWFLSVRTPADLWAASWWPDWLVYVDRNRMLGLDSIRQTHNCTHCARLSIVEEIALVCTSCRITGRGMRRTVYRANFPWDDCIVELIPIHWEVNVRCGSRIFVRGGGGAESADIAHSDSRRQEKFGPQNWGSGKGAWIP